MTDASGDYSIPGVAPGIVDVIASAQGYSTATQIFTLIGDTRVDFVLSRAPNSGGFERNGPRH